MQASEFEQYFNKFPHLKKHFVGVFAIDTLPKTLKYRYFCISNTDLSSEPGQHWICFLRNSNYEIECFDSLGINSEKREKLLKFCSFKRMRQLKFNENIFQCKDSSTCGLFVIYFLIERMHNLDLTFNQVLEEIFENSDTQNELKVEEFCKKILNNDL
jgi:hypothetical protein